MTLTGTNTYLVEDGAGSLAIVDPGPDDLPSHLDAILAAAQPLGRIATILVTHRHSDHLPLAFPLAERSGAVVVGHRDLPGVQQPLADGERCFGPLVALETPGHTRDSLCYWDASTGALFTGDLVVGTGSVIVDDVPGALSDYMRSLSRLQTLEPKTIYPGHGPIVDNAIAKLQDYVDHRRAREQQVVDALARSGPASVEQLVSAIYVDVAPNLVKMAARNVRACLDKLASEDRVTASNGQWQLSA
jgi:glyoxylase-like metal-dependent hydrolase (beta-lactamase superfamily II)